jgi:hypothetical protein
MRPASAAPPDCSKPGCVLADDVLALIMTAVAGGYIQERETTTIEIALVGDAILGRQPLPDALTWHCASSLQTNDTGREERKFHCGLHKAIQGTRRLAARLDERRHQYALLHSKWARHIIRRAASTAASASPVRRGVPMPIGTLNH